MAGKHVLTLLVVALLMSSCIDDYEQAAVTTSPEGGLRVLHHPCRADMPAQAIELLVDDGDTVGNGNDIILWKATAGNRPVVASDVMTFEPGHVPTGYVETVPLDAPASGEEVIVYVTVRVGGSFVVGFPWGSLREGRLVTQAGTKSRSEWLDYAIEGCGGT
jgi:hypothetical protein